jgi:hypothetical protein
MSWQPCVLDAVTCFLLFLLNSLLSPPPSDKVSSSTIPFFGLTKIRFRVIDLERVQEIGKVDAIGVAILR